VCCSVLRSYLIIEHVFHSVLQCVAVYCSALQCIAVCCSVLQCVAVRHSMLQRVAVSCSVLQCVAVCVAVCVAACCSVLQCVAECCSGYISAVHQCGLPVKIYGLELCCVCCSGCCSVLQCVAVYLLRSKSETRRMVSLYVTKSPIPCSALQRVQCVAPCVAVFTSHRISDSLQCVAVWCIVVQCDALCPSVLQSVAVRCTVC